LLQRSACRALRWCTPSNRFWSGKGGPCMPVSYTGNLSVSPLYVACAEIPRALLSWLLNLPGIAVYFHCNSIQPSSVCKWQHVALIRCSN
jgi:hypothetical protein